MRAGRCLQKWTLTEILVNDQILVFLTLVHVPVDLNEPVRGDALGADDERAARFLAGTECIVAGDGIRSNIPGRIRENKADRLKSLAETLVDIRNERRMMRK